MINSRSTAGKIFSLGFSRAHWKNTRLRVAMSAGLAACGREPTAAARLLCQRRTGAAGNQRRQIAGQDARRPWP